MRILNSDEIKNLTYEQGLDLMFNAGNDVFVAIVMSENKPVISKFTWDKDTKKWQPYVLEVIYNLLDGKIKLTWKHALIAIITYIIGISTDGLFDISSLIISILNSL